MTTTNNLNTVKRIGAGVRLTETAVPEIVATLPKGFDAEKRGAVAAAVVAWAIGDGPEEKQMTGPKGASKPTDFGRGVNTLVKAVKRALNGDTDKPVTLRATLSGEGGGSTTIPTDHPLYAALVALITSDESAAA